MLAQNKLPRISAGARPNTCSGKSGFAKTTPLFDERTRTKKRTLNEAMEIVMKHIHLISLGMSRWKYNRISHDLIGDMHSLLFTSMLKSALYWEPQKGAFSTYAVANMQECKRDVAMLTFPIHVPSDKSIKLMQYLRWKNENPEKEPKEFAEVRGLSIRQMNSLMETLPLFLQRGNSWDTAHLFDSSVSESLRKGCSSFSGNISPASAINAAPWLALKMNPSVEKDMDRATLKNTLLELIETHLTARQKEVLKLRLYGNGGEGMTLKEIGEMLKISRERVRQIELESGKKLLNTCPERLGELMEVVRGMSDL